MRSCSPGIWPALVPANKYSKARNHEARRGEMRGIRAESCPFSRLMARDFQIIFTRFLSGERRIEMRVCMRSSLCARRNAASCELIHDARIANNRVRRSGCGLSRPVIPRVQQRDCNERASERTSERLRSGARAFSYCPRESREK